MRTEKKFSKKDFFGWLMMLPALLLFCFFVWEPLLESVRMSVFSTKGIELQRFVGLDNYIQVIQSSDFRAAVLNTVIYIIWSLVIGFVVPIIFAVLITEAAYGKSFFRMAVYLPNMLPGMAVALMWIYFFRPGDTGILNILLSKCGIAPQAWINHAALVIPVIVIAVTWKNAGATALIYMAGICGIPAEYYEAAAIDGAGVWQRIFYITLPSILKLGRTMFLLQVISVFQILYEPLVLTNGGPNNASLSIMLLVYRYAFKDYNYAYATALSVMISLVLIALSGIYFKWIAKKES